MMDERRVEARMLCADLIETWWMDSSGRRCDAMANLEDISNSGACLQMDSRVPGGTILHICHSKVEFSGQVRYCVFRETGYFVGVQFEEGFRWDTKLFRPKHMLDPRRLLRLCAGSKDSISAPHSSGKAS